MQRFKEKSLRLSESTRIGAYVRGSVKLDQPKKLFCKQTKYRVKNFGNGSMDVGFLGTFIAKDILLVYSLSYSKHKPACFGKNSHATFSLHGCQVCPVPGGEAAGLPSEAFPGLITVLGHLTDGRRQPHQGDSR